MEEETGESAQCCEEKRRAAILSHIQRIRYPSRMLTAQMYRNVFRLHSTDHLVLVVYTLVIAMSRLLPFVVDCIGAVEGYLYRCVGAYCDLLES